MPFVAYHLGHLAPVRRGATLREVDAVAAFIDNIQSGDTPLDFISRVAGELADAHPEADVAVALRTESGGAMLVEVSGGAVIQTALGLRDPDGLEVDPDSDYQPAVSVAPPAAALAVWANEMLGEPSALEADGDDLLLPLETAAGLEVVVHVLGVVAQRMTADSIASVILLDDGFYTAQLDPERGARLRPTENTGETDKLALFHRLSGLPVHRAGTDWVRPPVPDVVSAAPIPPPADADRPLETGSADKRNTALFNMMKKPTPAVFDAVVAALASGANRAAMYEGVRRALYRALVAFDDPLAAGILWEALRTEDDDMVDTVIYHAYRFPEVVERLAPAVIEHWDTDRQFAVRLLRAMIEANERWPVELVDRAPEGVESWLRRHALWPG